MDSGDASENELQPAAFIPPARVLAVDDDGMCLALLEHDLKAAGFNPVCAVNGKVALDMLERYKDIELVVLDRSMPQMDGMQVLAAMKADSRLSAIPVIMQTASVLSYQVEEGIQAGAYYYLTKPYDPQMLIGIIRAALRKSRNYHLLREEVKQHKPVLGLLEKAHFHFRTLEEAKNVAFYIANCCPKPQDAVLGLSELMINAVEHGNLGITFDEKTRLIMRGEWENEVNSRLRQPEYRDVYAKVGFESTRECITITISDSGKGFDWEEYLHFKPERMTAPHGRGIAIAKAVAFSEITYREGGREVVCRIDLSPDEPDRS